MKVRVCPWCGNHNPEDVWWCTCGGTLSEDTIVDLPSEAIAAQKRAKRESSAKPSESQPRHGGAPQKRKVRFCTECGSEVDASHKFCWNCGQAVGRAIGRATAVRYEHCIIRGTNLRGGWEVFEAVTGDTVIARSRKIKGESVLGVLGGIFGGGLSGTDASLERWLRESTEARLELLSRLTSQGWEIFPPGQDVPETLRRVKR